MPNDNELRALTDELEALADLRDRAWAQAEHHSRRNEDAAALRCRTQFNALGRAIAALATAAPAGGEVDALTLAPHYRGYAQLGLGRYRLFHSASEDVAELCIVPATPEEVEGRTVGDLRHDGPDEIPAERMAVRIRFENVAGLDALEQQLRLLREDHFPAALHTPKERT